MILGNHFYQMSNAIFFYDLTPTEFMTYSYLVYCAGQKDVCWPSIHKIAVNCNCSENTARKAVASLAKQGFISKTATYEDRQDGRSRQTNNTYHVLALPPICNATTPGPTKRYRQVEDSTATPHPPP